MWYHSWLGRSFTLKNCKISFACLSRVSCHNCLHCQRQGRSDTYATEFDLEAEEYVPLPKGDVHKKKEVIQDVTLHDLDVANARPQVFAGLSSNCEIWYFPHYNWNTKNAQIVALNFFNLVLARSFWVGTVVLANFSKPEYWHWATSVVVWKHKRVQFNNQQCRQNSVY